MQASRSGVHWLIVDERPPLAAAALSMARATEAADVRAW